ncbi:MAG: winged helix-turn-helix transcriptional regulator [Acidimicrobiia bacterium]|nr:winged helix-turn-helix transcriptional regulator [Acidimicrobiia bacterium]
MVEQAGAAPDVKDDDERLSRAFAALGDPIRRDLVVRLAEADATVSELAAPYDVTVQAISKHVRVLEDAGLVTKTKDAQRRSVHLEDNVLDMMTGWIERYRRQAEARYSRLDALLAEMDADGRTGPADPATEANKKRGRAS